MQTYTRLILFSKQFEGRTADEARAKAKYAVSEGRILDQIIVRDVKEETISGTGNSPEAAIEAANRKVPTGSFDQSTGEIIQESQESEMEIAAYSEQEALNIWKRGAPEEAQFNKLSCLIAPNKGFLGKPIKKGSWKVSWKTPFIATITYKTPAIVKIVFEETH